MVTPTFTVTEEAFAANLNPLSGLPSDSRDVADRRPRAIAVSSWEAGAEPAGLQASEIVVEARLPGTGGLTAVSAEPPGERPEIGPLRSAAWPDLAAARALGATLVAADASGAVADEILASGIPNVLMMGGAGDSPAGTQWAGRTFSPGWEYTDEALAGGTPLSEIALPPVASTGSTSGTSTDDGSAQGVTWRHDPVLGLWRRLRGGVPELDAASGEGVVTANLVLLAVDGVPDSSDWWVGSGPAAVLRDGGLELAQWAREGPSEPLRLLDVSGEPALLRTGNTWIVLLPVEVVEAVLQVES